MLEKISNLFKSKDAVLLVEEVSNILDSAIDLLTMGSLP